MRAWNYIRTICIVCALAALPSATQAQNGLGTQFRLYDVLIIGDDESALPAYLFTHPEHIRTDREGRIYVAEGRTTGNRPGRSVRVFDSNGTSLGRLGRGGEGPGEFQNISAIALDSEQQLVVFDQVLNRFTRFAPFQDIDRRPLPEPDQITTYPVRADYQITVPFMHRLPGMQLIAFHQPGPGQRAPDQPRLHVYDEELQRVISLGQPGEWALPNDAFSRHLMQTPLLFEGSHIAPQNPTLVLAPTLYAGVLYRYTRDASGGWTVERLQGRDPGHATHKVVDSPDRPFSLFTSAGIGARYRSASRGVGLLNDGRIVHLSVSEDESGRRQLQLELFSADGTLHNVGRIDGFEHSETEFQAINQAVNVSLEWIDPENRLYLVDRRSGVPVLRVVTLEETN